MTRLAAPAALVVAAIVVAIVLMGGGDYVVHARFVDAGQLVKGGLIEVAGREVGTVRDIKLTDDGVADVQLAITDGEFKPLHRGTVARVRTVGLSGVANRFVELQPGPASAAEIPDDGVMTTAETRPIVDLDVVLDALDPNTRTHIQHLFKEGAETFAAGTTEDANRAFGYLNPALTQSDLLASELARDRVALRRLISTGATTVAALASRRDDVQGGITTTAATLRAIAGERASIADTFSRAPAVLGQARGTLHDVGGALAQLRPALREAAPVTPRLTRVLERLVPVSRATRPVLAATRAVLPALTSALTGAPALERAGTPALRSTTSAVAQAMPVFAGLRPYTPDLIAGLVNGFGGTAAGYYDANGEYARIELVGGNGTLQGLTPTSSASAAFRSGNDARCPGGASETAGDKSNPWVPDTALCDPKDDH